MTEAAELDARAGFAGLMARAAEAAAPEGTDPEAPYGWTTDPDGTRRPKKAAGRPSRRQKALDELKAEREAAPETPGPAGDRPPDASRRRNPRRPRTAGGEDKPKSTTPQFREGQIERAVNRAYRKGGKIYRAFDRDIGQALIDITRKEDADDVTVGEAWENLARVNPRIRAVLMRFIGKSAWGELAVVHGPVLVVILMKDSVRRRLPFARIMDEVLTPDEDGQAPADGTPLAGLQPQDMAQMMDVARQFAERAMNGPRTPDTAGA